MTSLFNQYNRHTQPARIIFLSFAAIVLNGFYCLAYRYSVGNPATFIEAFSWGAINIAPWLAAIEIGRHMRRVHSKAMIVAVAALASLTLGTAFSGQWPDMFEVVRRIPGMLIVIAGLVTASLLVRKNAGRAEDISGELASSLTCDWVRAAGNYVEVHAKGCSSSLIRSSLADYVAGSRATLVRIHRSYAVRRDSIEKVENASVKLKCGVRLPVGNAYRSSLQTG